MLIVEDKAVNRYVLKSIFEEDYEIVECADGRAAIELLEEGARCGIGRAARHCDACM